MTTTRSYKHTLFIFFLDNLTRRSKVHAYYSTRTLVTIINKNLATTAGFLHGQDP